MHMHVVEQRLQPILAEMEEYCAQAEAALRSRQWDRFKLAMREQRRLRQAITNELASAKCELRELPQAFARLQAIFTFRNDQLRRLVTYRSEVSKRLQITRKWKDATRSARRGIGPSPMLISRVL